MKNFIAFKCMIVFFAASIWLAPQTRAQTSFMHSAGATYLVGIGDEFVLTMPAVTYNPRIHFGLGGEIAVAVSALPTLGFYGSFNSRTGGSGGVGVDLPLNFQFHYGMGSSKDSDKTFGIYAGAGIDFAAIGSGDDWGTAGGTFLGPDFELGVNFWVKNSPIGIRSKFLYNVSSSNVGVFGLGIVYHFGLK